jgi:hypothetical protein
MDFRRCGRGQCLSLRTCCAFGLPDEAEIDTEQEENEMDDGTATADLGCCDKTCPQERHRNIGEIEIELDPRADKECARQKFAKFPAMPCEIERGQTEDDQCDENCGDHAAIEWPNYN